MTKAMTLFSLCLLTAQIGLAQQFYPGVDDKSLVGQVVGQCLKSKEMNDNGFCVTVRNSIDEKLPSVEIWSDDYFAAVDSTVNDLYKNCSSELKTETCQQLEEEIIKFLEPYKSTKSK